MSVYTALSGDEYSRICMRVVNNTFFWVTPYTVVGIHQRFGGTYCLNIHVGGNTFLRNLMSFYQVTL
jgi:hypothetical protein